MSLTFYGKTRCLSQEDVELLCNQLPGGDALRINLEKALASLPLPGGGSGPGVGHVLDPTDYEPVIKAIQSVRQTGVSISTDLAGLQTDLECAQDPAADPTAPPLNDSDSPQSQTLPLGGDGYQIEPPTPRG
jgi:hypothetical protein